jgi:hypothetical protein
MDLRLSTPWKHAGDGAEQATIGRHAVLGSQVINRAQRLFGSLETMAGSDEEKSDNIFSFSKPAKEVSAVIESRSDHGNRKGGASMTWPWLWGGALGAGSSLERGVF